MKEFKTTLFTLQGNTFQPSNPLPMEVQFSAVIGVDYLDVNGDGLEDVKSLKVLRHTSDGQPLVLAGVNNGPVRLFRLSTNVDDAS